MGTRSDLREVLVEEFKDADYPVSSPMDLIPALSNGPATQLETDDISLSVMELQSKLGSYQDFPYEDVDALVDDALDGLEEEGVIEAEDDEE